jgi:hypothetical protein
MSAETPSAYALAEKPLSVEPPRFKHRSILRRLRCRQAHRIPQNADWMLTPHKPLASPDATRSNGEMTTATLRGHSASQRTR